MDQRRRDISNLIKGVSEIVRHSGVIISAYSQIEQLQKSKAYRLTIYGGKLLQLRVCGVEAVVEHRPTVEGDEKTLNRFNCINESIVRGCRQTR